MTLILCARDGTRLAEVVGAVYTCTWLISDAGSARFTLSTSDPACREELLRPGNLVLIEHENGLPSWGGVIELPREWGRGSVTIHAKSGEQLLQYRRAARLGQILRGTAGAIYRQILQIAVGNAWLPIEVGSIFEDGESREETLQSKLMDEVKRIAERARNEFVFEPVTRDGKLVFVAHWYERAGAKVDYTAVEGLDLRASERPLVEQGELVNDLLGYGEGASWQSRPVYTGLEDGSIARYGVYQDAMGFDGNTYTGTLEANVRAELAKKARPVVTLDCRISNDRGGWNYLRRGNEIGVALHSVGFTGASLGTEQVIRIMGMEYDGQTVRVIGENDG